MKKLTALVVTALLAITLTGCNQDGEQQSTTSEYLREEHITLEDGSDVLCITYYGKALQCDFANATQR